MTVRELMEEMFRFEMDAEVKVEIVETVGAYFEDIHEVRFDKVNKSPVLVVKNNEVT